MSQFGRPGKVIRRQNQPTANKDIRYLPQNGTSIVMSEELMEAPKTQPLPPAAVAEAAASDPAAANGSGEYTAENIKHLSDLEHVRLRPAMYIGDITGRG